MTSYTHLTIREREMIFLYHGFGFTIRRIGRLIKRSHSTVMRELRRNTTKFRTYSPSLAQKSYHKNKQKCGRKGRKSVNKRIGNRRGRFTDFTCW